MILYAAHRVVDLSTKQTFRSVFAPPPPHHPPPLSFLFWPSLSLSLFCLYSIYFSFCRVLAVPVKRTCLVVNSRYLYAEFVLTHQLIHHLFHDQQQPQLGLVCVSSSIFGGFGFPREFSRVSFFSNLYTSPAITHTQSRTRITNPPDLFFIFSFSFKCPSLSAPSSSSSSCCWPLLLLLPPLHLFPFDDFPPPPPFISPPPSPVDSWLPL